MPLRMISVLASLCMACAAYGQQSDVKGPELLWPDGAPGALGQEAKDKPTFVPYLPSKIGANGAGVVILPGGGYGFVAIDHEGHDVAKWLNTFGVAAFVVDYRHRTKGYGHPAPLQDAQRAIRTVRSRAKEFGVDPNRVGVLGFSAGGHLASTALTHFDAGNSGASDLVMRESSRPDFGILCYPVIAFDEPFTHKGSQVNLLGEKATAEEIRGLSNEKQVTDKTPPTFLWHTAEDKPVPPQNSLVFFRALVEHGVPAELHVFEKGQHGIGLGADIPGASDWTRRCEVWMKNRGLLSKKQP